MSFLLNLFFCLSLSQVDFSDVLAEPVSTHTYDRVWVYSSIGFESARIWGYRCLTALCAVPVSLLSGCLFALVACLHIWYNDSTSLSDVFVFNIMLQISEVCMYL